MAGYVSSVAGIGGPVAGYSAPVAGATGDEGDRSRRTWRGCVERSSRATPPRGQRRLPAAVALPQLILQQASQGGAKRRYTYDTAA